MEVIKHFQGHFHGAGFTGLLFTNKQWQQNSKDELTIKKCKMRCMYYEIEPVNGANKRITTSKIKTDKNHPKTFFNWNQMLTEYLQKRKKRIHRELARVCFWERKPRE